jgi:hypothetical protein
MPLLADRVRETSATTGTGTLTLAGAVAGYQGFNAAFANADTVYYVIHYATEWEVGIGTVGTGTLSRDSVLASSNADALVPFSAGTKDVFVAYVAERAVTTSDAATLTNKTIDSITNLVGADHIHYKIKANATITKGQTLKAVGYNAGEAAIEVVPISSASDIAVGIAYQNLASGDFGAAINTGLLIGVKTDFAGWALGDVLYPDPSTGGLTKTKPTSGTYQACAYVMRVQSNNGVLLCEFTEPQQVMASTNTANTAVLRDGSGNFAAGTITAALTGNASTATTLATARNINGVSFNGSADITVTAAAGTLSGSTLAAGVTASSLTSVGTLTSLGVSGVTTLQAGTALLPALTTSGDPNTGVFFPAADTVAVTTGGTERWRINSSGNVGIGTTNPTSRLDVRGGAITELLVGESGGFAGSLSYSGSTGNITLSPTFSSASILFATNATSRWQINSSGHFLAGADNTYDIGASGATRPRNLYTGSDAFIAGRRLGAGASALSQNTAFGLSTLNAVTTGNANTAIGHEAGLSITSGPGNTIVGAFSGRVISTGQLNTVVGASSLSSATTGVRNVAVGYETLSATNADNSVAVGFQAGRSSTVTITAIGSEAGFSHTSGAECTFVGAVAAYGNITGSNNTAIGFYASLRNETGSSNTAVGRRAMLGVSGNSHSNNTAVGADALTAVTTGGTNTAVGASALSANTTGANNTAIGHDAARLITAGTSATTNANSVFLGQDARPSANGNTNEMVLGYLARGNGSNTATYGNSSVTDHYFTGNGRFTGYVRVGAASAGVASTTTIGNGTSTTVGATGAADALPANPLGYIIAHVGTTQVKIPYYTA